MDTASSQAVCTAVELPCSTPSLASTAADEAVSKAGASGMKEALSSVGVVEKVELKRSPTAQVCWLSLLQVFNIELHSILLNPRTLQRSPKFLRTLRLMAYFTGRDTRHGTSEVARALASIPPVRVPWSSVFCATVRAGVRS